MNSLIRLIACIRQGQRLRKNLIRVQHSQPSLGFLKVLWEEGLILGYGEWDLDLESTRPVPRAIKMDKDLFVVLKYNHGLPVIKKLDSRPIFLKAAQLEEWQGTPELFVLSTAQLGIVSHKEAFQKKIGGQLLCRITI